MYPLLEVTNLAVSFAHNKDRVIAVDHISFTVEKGEVVALVGESGSGKSVTSLSILQLLPQKSTFYNSGEIFFSQDGESRIDLLKAGGKELQIIRGQQVAMIFQEPMTALNPVFTCGNQLVEAIRAHKKTSYKQATILAIDWLKKVRLPLPQETFNKYPHELSGGQKQRVMIAMAMCCNPTLLICDEPTTALDVTVQKSILELIAQLSRENNMGVIFITHDLGVVNELAHKVIVMRQGNIVEQGTTQHVLTNPVHPYTQALLACRPGRHKKGERLPVVDDFLKHREPNKEASPVQNITTGNVVLSVKNLYVEYAGKKVFLQKKRSSFKAVNNISFNVKKGETLGLVGESGCGKTTVGRALLRLVDTAGGSIVFNGIDLAKLDKKKLKAFRQHVQIVFQDPYSSLNPRLGIGQAIMEPMQVNRFYKTTTEARNNANKLLQNVNLNESYFNRYPHELSGGQRQRIVMARALALNPSFIVFDESVSALDVSVQAQVLNLINDLKKEFGLTIIFISHDLSVIRYMCDRVLVMNKGEIVEEGNVDAVYNNPQHEYTRRLLASIPGSTSA